MKEGRLHAVIIFAIATPVMLWLTGRTVIVRQSQDLPGREVVARDDGTLVIGPVSWASVSDLLLALRLGAALYRWKRLPGRARTVLQIEAERVRRDDARARFFGFSDAEVIISQTLAGLPATSRMAQEEMNRLALPELLRWGLPIGPVFLLAILPIALLSGCVKHILSAQQSSVRRYMVQLREFLCEVLWWR